MIGWILLVAVVAAGILGVYAMIDGARKDLRKRRRVRAQVVAREENRQRHEASFERHRAELAARLVRAPRPAPVAQTGSGLEPGELTSVIALLDVVDPPPPPRRTAKGSIPHPIDPSRVTPPSIPLANRRAVPPPLPAPARRPLR